MMLPLAAAALAVLSVCPSAYAMPPLHQPDGFDNNNGTTNGTADGNSTSTDPMAACKLPAHMNVWLSSGFAPTFDCVPSQGTIRGFMIFVDFPDATANMTGASPKELYDSIVPAANDWFKTSSYGQLSLNVTADTSKFHRMPAPTTSYGWTAMTGEMHAAYIQDALDAYLHCGRALPEAVDVLYVMAPPSAQGFFNSLTTSFRPTMRSGSVVAQRASTMGVDVYDPTVGYRTLVHETGHTMCLADYYPTDRLNPLGYFVGGFSLMGDSTQPYPDHFAWDKWRMGWLPDTAVECVSVSDMMTTTRHILTPLEQTPRPGEAQAVVIAASDTRALVAEARTQKGVDEQLCGAGVLLYTVDTQVASGMGPIRVLNNTPDRYTCGGYPANRAPLSLDEGRSRTMTVEEFGVTVTLTDQVATDRFMIEVKRL
ncbi:hypothetical protein PG995_002965 [Apiospora arundinis]